MEILLYSSLYLLLYLLPVAVVAMAEVMTTREHDKNNYKSPCYGSVSTFVAQAEPFSVARYFDHIEETFLKIHEKREKEPDYTIILWWAFDGLRLNKDGNTEWISRRKKAEPRAECRTNEDFMRVLAEDALQFQKAKLDIIMQQNAANMVNVVHNTRIAETPVSRTIDGRIAQDEVITHSDISIHNTIHTEMGEGQSVKDINGG